MGSYFSSIMNYKKFFNNDNEMEEKNRKLDNERFVINPYFQQWTDSNHLENHSKHFQFEEEKAMEPDQSNFKTTKTC